MREFHNKLKELKVVPVVVIKNLDDTLPTMQALLDGGLPVAEITFRSECASESIKIASKEFSNMLIGAGTILNKEQANLAIECGAKFIVSPGFSKDILKFVKIKIYPIFQVVLPQLKLCKLLNAELKL